MSHNTENFIARWQQSLAAERANYALFLSELCDYLEIPRPEPTQAEESANSYVIDKAVYLQNLDGSTTPNYIDLYKRRCFVLEAKQGSNPSSDALVWTKTLAVGSSSILAIMLVPVLMVLLIRGKLRPERENPVSQFTQALYLPVLRFCLKHRALTITLNLLFLIATIPIFFKLGSQFMPLLVEGSALYMPTSLPGISIEQAKTVMQKQDALLRAFPEVESVFGSVGRSDSATDNAPLDMFDTTIMTKPKEQWRRGMTYEKLIQEMDASVQFPGISNTWTSPVECRLDMELTGIKTPLGIKVQGPKIDEIERLAGQIQSVLATMPQQRSSFAERISQGFYVNVDVDRDEAARYGLSVADVQTAVSSGIGGRNVAENIEG